MNIEIQKPKFGKDDFKKAGIFLLICIVSYSLLTIASRIFPMEFYENIVAQSVLFILNILGIKGSIALQEPVLITLASGAKIEISFLCTGLMELFVIISAITASQGISLKKRAAGIAAALVIAPLFNLFRIIATILLILNTQSIGLIDFTHDILFRITLFAVIMGIYTVWFLWAVNAVKTGKKSNGPEKEKFLPKKENDFKKSKTAAKEKIR